MLAAVAAAQSSEAPAASAVQEVAETPLNPVLAVTAVQVQMDLAVVVALVAATSLGLETIQAAQAVRGSSSFLTRRLLLILR
jgi:hypothetical protein